MDTLSIHLVIQPTLRKFCLGAWSTQAVNSVNIHSDPGTRGRRLPILVALSVPPGPFRGTL